MTPCASLSASSLTSCHRSLRIILQLVEAAGRQHIARVDSLHLGSQTLGDSHGNWLQMGAVVLNHIDKRLLSVVLNRIGRNQSGIVYGVNQ
jgi:hypothetical protein